jgi:hypothetical protein
LEIIRKLNVPVVHLAKGLPKCACNTSDIPVAHNLQKCMEIID